MAGDPPSTQPETEEPSPPETEAPPPERSSVLFRLPFDEADGSPAMLNFHPTPLPHAPTTTQQPTPAPPGFTATAENPDTHHQHPAGHVPVRPLFVPFGASPLPFAFIYDSATRTAWPIVQVTPGSPPGGPSPDAPNSQRPRLVAGPPFQIILDVHFGPAPEPEQADPERAAKYVADLEHADAELRSRMVRLGLGSIGGFGQDDEDALLGCGICLDNYEEEDRPEWLDGKKSQDDAVVAVPCAGHHTLHAGCLRDWLAKLPPSQWTCPFCRASLNAKGKSESGKKSATPPLQTLRDVVRKQERENGWRCDGPACLARYPASTNKKGHVELSEVNDQLTTRLITLMPCKHAVHLDCLCTSARVENQFADLDESVDDEASDGAVPSTPVDDKDTVGKWVNCPACRKEVWAELPLSRKPQPRQQAPSNEEDTVEALLT